LFSPPDFSRMNRRSFLKTAIFSPLAMSLLPGRMRAEGGPRPGAPLGKAEHCIFIWLGGGMSQIDTFDPKGLGDNRSASKKPGSFYEAIETSVPGVRLCEHLRHTARLMESVTVVRTVHHKVIDEHAFATNLVHTGRMVSGNAVYPSLGSIVAHERGAADPSVPAYLLIGYPNVSRGPGFLGSRDGYVYLTDTQTGPAGFSRPEGLDAERVARRLKLLEPLRARAGSASAVGDYAEAQQEAMRLSGPQFMRHFNLGEEEPRVRESYGGEFGQRCLTARRLVQAGARFVEVSHNLNFLNGSGWDIHNEGIRNQHLLIQELDVALAALLADLRRVGMLDRTLVVLGTEFGRPADFDGRGGRGHQGSVFSMVLAGGGLRHCGAYGVTDDFSKTALEKPVSIPDFHATILAALGISPARELMDGSRPVPITDQGTPIAELF
jgi:hypothetical protein